MRFSRVAVLAVVGGVFSHATLLAQQLLNVPLRINMGGTAQVDSHDNLWLGDAGAGADPLNIRPDDAGGFNAEEGWFQANFQADSLDALGFDGTHPGDISIFNSIRWDDGALPPDFYLEIPIPNGGYLVNLFFNEGCCDARHFKIEIQGEIVDDDVSYLDYDVGNPALGRLGRLSFDASVSDQILRIGFLPCPECPGATDTNAIIDAIEILSGPDCDHDGLNFNCSFDAATDRVTGTWNTLINAEGYRILKNGVAFGADLPGNATSFTDPSPRSGGINVNYAIQALDGGVPFTQCRCSLQAVACPGNLACTSPPGTSRVDLSWGAPLGLTVTGYEVLRNGVLVDSLPGSATSYQDNSPGLRPVEYTVNVLTNPPGLCSGMSCCAEDLPFELPVRLNMGGPSLVDSQGRLWLGDGPGPGDLLCIRPDDSGGTNFILNWCLPDAQSMLDLGFDPGNVDDVALLTTIRWDNGADASEFRLHLAVPNDDYKVNLFFNECCCPQRHFKLEVEGEIVDPDVSMADYNLAPALGKVGRLTFDDVGVVDGSMDIALLPCPDPECPGGTDGNAIINAVELIPKNPCPTDPTFRQCPEELACTVGPGGAVSGTWTRGIFCSGLFNGYELRKDGLFLQNLPANATGFADTLVNRVAFYELIPLVGAGEDACPTLTCTAVREDVPFTTPLRINMGGSTRRDSRGRLWLGDGNGPGDALSLRPDDLGGTNTIENWCTALSQSHADSLGALGLDALSRDDQAIFNTIRWDLADDDDDGFFGEAVDPDGGDTDFRMELPVPNGTYLLNLYFTECCCPLRHFALEIQDALVELDISTANYSVSGALGRTGRLSYHDISVTNGILRLALLPCLDPDCVGSIDGNAIIDALEVLPNNTVNQTCPQDLICAVEVNGDISGSWTAPENVSLTGYNLYRNGTLVTTLPAGATSFTDTPPCVRVVQYEVEPLSGAADFLCPGLRMSCTTLQPACPFEAPVRINMGGVEVTDSNGHLWIGDGPGPGDPLEIRPDDASGTNWIENWCGVAADSLTAIGFDPNNAADRYIMTGIRWDLGNDGIDFRLEIPILDQEYTVNLYFNECCCANRHFKIELEGEIVDPDVSYLDYDTAAPALGRAGRLTFPGIAVADGFLDIAFLPCPDCAAGVVDTNAIINAIEILATGTFEICNNSIDDDGDQRIDCADSDCSNSPSCREVCNNQRDDDGDLLTDCGDPDCAADPICQTGGRFHRGDSNNDGRHNISDPVNTLNVLFLGFGSIPCQDAADSNDDGKVNISDPVNSLNVLFLGTGAIPPPLPPEALVPCGTDPTPNVPPLGCDSYTNC